ncbi:MAG: hypothetical protein IJ106_09215 [Parasporobacterium sp.]|nr:hypothetical protein [Parasporobacterium sp.]
MKKIITWILLAVMALGVFAPFVSAQEAQEDPSDYQDYLWDLSEDLPDEEFAVLALRNYKFIQSLELLTDPDSFQTLYKANVHLKQKAEGSREEFIEAQNSIRMNSSVADSVIFLWDKDHIPALEGEELTEEELDAAPLDGVGFVPFLIKQLLDDPSQAKGNILLVSGGAGSNRSNAGEAYPAVEVFRELGYNTFVLQYRIAPYSWEDMYMDTQRAVRMIRYYAQQEGWGGQDMIAAAGWSAGSMCIAGAINYLYGALTPTVFDPSYEPDEIDGVSSDLDVAMLIYGGTIEEDCANPNLPALYLSVGTEDPLFGVEDRQAIYDLAVSRNVPALLQVIEGAGHGYGVGGEKLPEECALWPQEADAFMMENKGHSENALPADTSAASDLIEVVCVGDSITAAGYPEVLAELLGDAYEVNNYGQPGAQMVSGERFSYMDLDLFQESLDLGADYYFLMLGSNDSMAGEKWDPEAFRRDYTAFLNAYTGLGESTNVYVLISPAVYKDEENPRALAYRVDLDILNQEIRPMIREIAEELGIPTIDIYSLTDGHPELLADGLHPNEDGNCVFAQAIYDQVFAEQ